MQSQSPSIVNIAAYKFVELSGLDELRAELSHLCEARNLRGSILLSEEGVNLFVAGLREDVDALLARLRRIPGAGDLEAKESFSRERPFNRMVVKIKHEIIAFGIDGIDPRRHTSKRVSALELKRWLDEGRPVTLLDTRNDFEIKVGTFDHAMAAGVDDFRNFPDAVRRLPEEMKNRTVVTFCTGGIRCEKAAPYLEREGFRDVYQLDGGILKYFEEVGGEHYHGECFVFDKRVALDAELKETQTRQCFVCWNVLSDADLSSPKYIEGKSCPHCFRTEPMPSLTERQQAIADITRILPGSVPYENHRPLSVPLRFDRYELLDFLDGMRTHLSREEWRAVCDADRLLCRELPARPGRIVRSGERFVHVVPATREPDVNANITILHEDDAIVVVSKPAPLPMHPCGRFNRNTLTHVLNQAFRPIILRPAHRLDADTSGIVVLSKSREIAQILQPRFESKEVRKSYLARVHGHPIENVFECHAPLSDDPGPNGVRLPDANGVAASTRFAVRERFDDGTTLLDVEPLTGRTNQIRAHLWSLGLPIVGDPIYLRNGKLGEAKTLSVDDPPLCLHAAAIEFAHPQSGLTVRFEAAAPDFR